jgi:hypothetical protein
MLKIMQNNNLIFILNELGTLNWVKSHELERNKDYKVISQNIIDFNLSDNN